MKREHRIIKVTKGRHGPEIRDITKYRAPTHLGFQFAEVWNHLRDEPVGLSAGSFLTTLAEEGRLAHCWQHNSLDFDPGLYTEEIVSYATVFLGFPL